MGHLDHIQTARKPLKKIEKKIDDELLYLDDQQQVHDDHRPANALLNYADVVCTQLSITD